MSKIPMYQAPVSNPSSAHLPPPKRHSLHGPLSEVLSVVVPHALVPLPKAPTRDRAPFNQWAIAQAPAVARSLARGQVGPFVPCESDPLEAWLNDARVWLRPHDGVNWWVHPVHFQLAPEGVYMIAPDELALSPEHTEALWADVAPLLKAQGWDLTPDVAPFLSGQCWSSEQALPLGECSPWQAGGLSTREYLSLDPAARGWRVLWNDIQQHLYDHPVNQARQAAGLLPVNAFWWWPHRPSAQVFQIKGLESDGPLSQRLQGWLQSAASEVMSKTAHITVLEGWELHHWFNGQSPLLAALDRRCADWLAAGLPFQWVLLGEQGYRTVRVGRSVRWAFWKNTPPADALWEPVDALLDEAALQHAHAQGLAQQDAIQSQWDAAPGAQGGQR